MLKKISVFCLLGTIFFPLLGMDFSVSGQMVSFSKFGFNNQNYNPKKDIYPTESYSSILGEFNLHMNIIKGLNTTIGGVANGLVYDSTIFQGKQDWDYPYQIGTNYIGYYAGHSGQKLQSPKFLMLHNIYVDYDYEGIFGLKAGRYETKDKDWFSAHNQGVEIYVKYTDTKAWAMFSDARASTFADWFWSYGRYYSNNEFLFAGGVEYFKNGLKISPYLYYIPRNLNAPGIHISYDTNTDFKAEGFRSKTTIVALFPIYHNSDSNDNIVFEQKLGKNAQSLFVKQEFDIDSYNLGVAFYANFGNGNGKIGIYGDPIGFNIWTGSVYDTGTSLSNIVGKDAVNGFLFIGSSISDFKWQLLGRLTKSPRADEQSLAIFLDYNFSSNLSIGFKIEYFNNITHKGYSIGSAPTLTKNNVSDRSHIMLYIIQTF